MQPTEKCEKWPKNADFGSKITVFAPILGLLVEKWGFGNFQCHGYTTEPSAPPARRKNFWGVFQAMRAKMVDVFFLKKLPGSLKHALVGASLSSHPPVQFSP